MSDCDQAFLFSCVAAALAASRDHDLTVSCLEEAFARCENGKTLKSPRVSRTIERILQSIADPTARDIDTMRTFFVNAGLGFQEATRCANLAIKGSIPSPMKLALLVARQGSSCLSIFSLSEEDESLILLAIRSGYSSPARRQSRQGGGAADRGMSSMLWPPHRGGEEEEDEEEEEEEQVEDEEGEEGEEEGELFPRASPLATTPRSRLSSPSPDAASPLTAARSPNTSGDGPHPPTMPLSAICSALKAKLGLSPSLGLAETVSEACSKLGVSRQNNLKLDAASAFAAAEGPAGGESSGGGGSRSAGSGSGGSGGSSTAEAGTRGRARVRALSDWTGEANPSSSAGASTSRSRSLDPKPAAFKTLASGAFSLFGAFLYFLTAQHNNSLTPFSSLPSFLPPSFRSLPSTIFTIFARSQTQALTITTAATKWRVAASPQVVDPSTCPPWRRRCSQAARRRWTKSSRSPLEARRCLLLLCPRWRLAGRDKDRGRGRA